MQYPLALSVLFIATLHTATGCRREEPIPLTTRVLLRDTQFLEAPAVPAGKRIFKPSLRLSAGSVDDVVAFKLTVDAATDDLMIQARPRANGNARLLERVDPPDVATDDFSHVVLAAGAIHASILTRGDGFYWIEPAETSSHYEIAVVLPGLATDPFWTVQVSPTAIEGVLIGGLDFELVQDFFYLVVIGDSIQWGNGLEEGDKMSTLVAATLESELGKGVVFQRYAHSGATIYEREGDGICEFNCFGEVPEVNTAILNQVDLVKRPDLVELVITDGCINDVNVANIVSPTKTHEEIAALAQTNCDEGMVLLLRRIRAAMPDAAIVVTGYYQIVSPLSDVLGLNAWLQSMGQGPSELTESLVPVLTANSIAFHETAHTGLRAAIATVASEFPASPPIGFADPGFAESNAIFAPEAWLWGMTADSELLDSLGIGLELAPTDDVLPKRLDRCINANLPLAQLIICLYASVGHPTAAGAEAFASAIIAELRHIGVLTDPLADPLRHTNAGG